MRAAVVVSILAVTLGACTTSRSTLGGCEAEVAGPPHREGPARPVTAHALAGRLGMTYRDSGDHVLLTDAGTRVRIWKDSDQVSVGGREVRMRGRTTRLGASLVLPAPMAAWVEREVGGQRSRLVAVRRTPPRTALPPLPEPEPLEASRPAPAAPVQPLRPRHAQGAADPAWTPAGAARSWRWIVIHHSDDTSGNLAKYDRIHREQNGWDSCGYHFVIGNGTLSSDGAVEVGPRWWQQKHGAHAKTPDNRFNDHGIGICLVGNFEGGGRPTHAQMEALVRLCRFLMERHGIPPDGVMRHSDCTATACPGRHFPWAELRRRLADPTVLTAARRGA